MAENLTELKDNRAKMFEVRTHSISAQSQCTCCSVAGWRSRPCSAMRIQVHHTSAAFANLTLAFKRLRDCYVTQARQEAFANQGERLIKAKEDFSLEIAAKRR